MTDPTRVAAPRDPEFQALLDRLQAERDALAAQTKPLRDERDQVVAQMQPLELRHRELTSQIRALELPRLADLDNRIAALHRAMGARSLQEGARVGEVSTT